MKKLIIYLMAIAMICSSAFAFSDTAEHPLAQYTQAAAAAGIITGYPDGTFRPDATVDRAGFTTMVNRALGISGCADIAFKDVPANMWYASEVEKALSVGYINGKSADIFAPTDTVTRGEAAVMLARLVGWQSTGIAYYSDFSDTLPDWLKTGITYAENAGIFSMFIPAGSEFSPYTPMTRAQCAAVITAFAETLAEKPVYLTMCKDSDDALFYTEDSVLTMHIFAKGLFSEICEGDELTFSEPERAAEAYKRMEQILSLQVTSSDVKVTGTYLKTLSADHAAVTLTVTSDSDLGGSITVTAVPTDSQYRMASGFESASVMFNGKEELLYAAIDPAVAQFGDEIRVTWNFDRRISGWAIYIVNENGTTVTAYNGDIVYNLDGMYADVTELTDAVGMTRGTIVLYGTADGYEVRPVVFPFDLTVNAENEMIPN